jgi:predicted dehydrogenase
MKILVVGAGMYVLGRGTGGCGTVLPALAQASRQIDIDGVTICSTSDRRRADVERAADEVNKRLGTTLRVRHETLDRVLRAGTGRSGFDAAIVSVPDHLHFDIGRQVLEGGLHCLMVKPFVLTTAEARQLIALADTRGLYGAVELHKRFDDANLIVRRLINEGRLGTLAYATVEYSQRITVPRDFFRAWAARTNVFQYLGVHYVDLLHFLTGFQPRRVLAAGRRGILEGLGIPAYDSVHVMIEWVAPAGRQDGFLSQLASGWIDPESSTAMSDQRYILVGSAGRVECDQKNRGLRVIGQQRGVDEINPYFSEYLDRPDGSLEFTGYGYRSIERFLLDVGGLKQGTIAAGGLEGLRPTFRSAFASTAVIQAVRESLEADSAWKEVDAAL